MKSGQFINVSLRR